MCARLSHPERALLLLGLLVSQHLVLGLLLLPGALFLVWVYFWLGNVAASALEGVQRTRDASRALRRREAKVEKRAVRKAMTRWRREHGTAGEGTNMLLGCLAAAVAAGIIACILIVLKGLLFLVIVGTTVWLYSCVIGCCAACTSSEEWFTWLMDAEAQGSSLHTATGRLVSRTNIEANKQRIK